MQGPLQLSSHHGQAQITPSLRHRLRYSPSPTVQYIIIQILSEFAAEIKSNSTSRVIIVLPLFGNFIGRGRSIFEVVSTYLYEVRDLSRENGIAVIPLSLGPDEMPPWLGDKTNSESLQHLIFNTRDPLYGNSIPLCHKALTIRQSQTFWYTFHPRRSVAFPLLTGIPTSCPLSPSPPVLRNHYSWQFNRRVLLHRLPFHLKQHQNWQKLMRWTYMGAMVVNYIHPSPQSFTSKNAVAGGIRMFRMSCLTNSRRYRTSSTQAFLALRSSMRSPWAWARTDFSAETTSVRASIGVTICPWPRNMLIIMEWFSQWIFVDKDVRWRWRSSGGRSGHERSSGMYVNGGHIIERSQRNSLQISISEEYLRITLRWRNVKNRFRVRGIRLLLGARTHAITWCGI